jgi:hypothetical protein
VTFRRTRCPHCLGKLDPGQRIHDACIAPWQVELKAKEARAEAKRQKMAAKVERARDRERKAALMRLSELKAKLQEVFNAYIRARDADEPCICCGEPFEPNKPGGSMDAGHYLSRGSSPQHRFNEDNVFGQRKNCNRPGGTTRDAFRAGVLARIGRERLEALETDSAPRKWTRDELLHLIDHYRAKTRELKRKEA